MTLAWSIRRGQSVATTPADSENDDEGVIVSDTGTEVKKELSFRSEVIKFNQRRRDETLRPTAGSEDAMASTSAKDTKPTKKKKTKMRVKAKSALSKATRGTFGEGKTHAALSKVTGGTFGEGKTRAKVKGAVSKATGGTFIGRKTKKKGVSKARSGSRSDDSSTGSDEGEAKGDDSDAATSQLPTTEEKEAPGDELAIENDVTRLLSGRRHVTRQQLWEAARFKTGATWGAAGASVLFRTRSEFDAALDMMEDMGLFVSHGNDTLYVQPSWLVDVMRRVVCHNPLPVEVEVEVQKTQQTPDIVGSPPLLASFNILYVARLRINAPVGDRRGGGRREIVLPARTAEEIIPLRPKLESFLLSTVPDDIDSACTPSTTTSTADRTLSVVRKIVATFPRLLADQRGGVPSLDPSYVAAQYKTHLDRYMDVCNRWDEFDDDATGMLGTQARAALVDALCMKSRTNTGLTKHWELRQAGSGINDGKTCERAAAAMRGGRPRRILCLASYETTKITRQVAVRYGIEVTVVNTVVEALENLRASSGGFDAVVAALGLEEDTRIFDTDSVANKHRVESRLITAVNNYRERGCFMLIFSRTASQNAGTRQLCDESGADAVVSTDIELDRLFRDDMAVLRGITVVGNTGSEAGDPASLDPASFLAFLDWRRAATKDLTRRGVLTQSTLNLLWPANDDVSFWGLGGGSQAVRRGLIRLMLDLDILARLDDETFLVPCLLPRPSERDAVAGGGGGHSIPSAELETKDNERNGAEERVGGGGGGGGGSVPLPSLRWRFSFLAITSEFFSRSLARCCRIGGFELDRSPGSLTSRCFALAATTKDNAAWGKECVRVTLTFDADRATQSSSNTHPDSSSSSSSSTFDSSTLLTPVGPAAVLVEGWYRSGDDGSAGDGLGDTPQWRGTAAVIATMRELQRGGGGVGLMEEHIELVVQSVAQSDARQQEEQGGDSTNSIGRGHGGHTTNTRVCQPGPREVNVGSKVGGVGGGMWRDKGGVWRDKGGFSDTHDALNQGRIGREAILHRVRLKDVKETYQWHRQQQRRQAARRRRRQDTHEDQEEEEVEEVEGKMRRKNEFSWQRSELACHCEVCGGRMPMADVERQIPEFMINGHESTDLMNAVVPAEHVDVFEVIGSGQFGDVCRGIVRRVTEGVQDAPRPAAIKKIQKALLSHPMEERKIRAECALQFSLHHPRIIECFGCCEHPRAFLVLLELCDSGELLRYLRDHAGRTGPALKLSWAIDLTEGIAYLHSKSFIHRDVAARNACLHYDASEGRLVCKLADLGMTRRVGRSGVWVNTEDDSFQDCKLTEAEAKEGEGRRVGIDTHGSENTEPMGIKGGTRGGEGRGGERGRGGEGGEGSAAKAEVTDSEEEEEEKDGVRRDVEEMYDQWSGSDSDNDATTSAPPLHSNTFLRQNSGYYVANTTYNAATGGLRVAAPWAAPEVMVKAVSPSGSTPQYLSTKSADMWSLAVTFWEICMDGFTPYLSPNSVRGWHDSHVTTWPQAGVCVGQGGRLVVPRPGITSPHSMIAVMHAMFEEGEEGAAGATKRMTASEVARTLCRDPLLDMAVSMNASSSEEIEQTEDDVQVADGMGGVNEVGVVRVEDAGKHGDAAPNESTYSVHGFRSYMLRLGGGLDMHSTIASCEDGGIPDQDQEGDVADTKISQSPTQVGRGTQNEAVSSVAVSGSDRLAHAASRAVGEYAAAVEVTSLATPLVQTWAQACEHHLGMWGIVAKDDASLSRLHSDLGRKGGGGLEDIALRLDDIAQWPLTLAETWIRSICEGGRDHGVAALSEVSAHALVMRLRRVANSNIPLGRILCGTIATEAQLRETLCCESYSTVSMQAWLEEVVGIRGGQGREDGKGGEDGGGGGEDDSGGILPLSPLPPMFREFDGQTLAEAVEAYDEDKAEACGVYCIDQDTFETIRGALGREKTRATSLAREAFPLLAAGLARLRYRQQRVRDHLWDPRTAARMVAAWSPGQMRSFAKRFIKAEQAYGACASKRTVPAMTTAGSAGSSAGISANTDASSAAGSAVSALISVEDLALFLAEDKEALTAMLTGRTNRVDPTRPLPQNKAARERVIAAASSAEWRRRLRTHLLRARKSELCRYEEMLEGGVGGIEAGRFLEKMAALLWRDAAHREAGALRHLSGIRV
jgi:serine/threonine protein kinase